MASYEQDTGKATKGEVKSDGDKAPKEEAPAVEKAKSAVNTADIKTRPEIYKKHLMEVQGIGPAKAEDIVEGFISGGVEEIADIVTLPGITERLLEKVKAADPFAAAREDISKEAVLVQ